jgi:hypothetical protein
MDERKYRPQLIGNRLTAAIAVCLTGFLAVRDFRAVFSGTLPKPGWLIPFDSMPLPIWAMAIVNLAFYVYMLWLGVVFYRWAQGNERVVVAGFFAGTLLSPIKALVSPPAVAVIRSVQAVGMTVAFLAATYIFLKSPATAKGNSKIAKQ